MITANSATCYATAENLRVSYAFHSNCNPSNQAYLTHIFDF